MTLSDSDTGFGQPANLSDVLNLLENITLEQLDAPNSESACLIGFVILTQRPEYEDFLPEESQCSQDLTLIKKALCFYKENNLTELQFIIKKIPYRSVFKDLVTILNTLIIKAPDFKKQHRLLNSISEQSPYYPLSQLISLFLSDGAELLKGFHCVTYSERKLIEPLKGFDEQQVELIDHMMRFDGQLGDREKLLIATTYQDVFGKQIAEQFCQTLLVDYPDGYQSYSKHFTSVNEFEENRIKALLFEQREDLVEAEYHWRQCINLLNAQGDSKKIAMILRHIADQQQNIDAQIYYLMESLDYDPDDMDSYLLVLQHAADIADEKACLHWLEIGQKQFSANVGFLELAMSIAVQLKNNALAIRYAESLLGLDSRCVAAKHVLLTIYLKNAKQYFIQAQYDAVNTELFAIDKLGLKAAQMLEVELLKGFLNYVNGDHDAFQQILETLKQTYSDSLNVRFKACLEILTLGLSLADFEEELKRLEIGQRSETAIKQLDEQIYDAIKYEVSSVHIHQALNHVTNLLLEHLTEAESNEDMWVKLANQLSNIKHFDLLLKIAEVAENKWDASVWGYYSILAKTEGQAEACSEIDISRLQQLYEQSRQSNQIAIAELIQHYINQYKKSHPGKFILLLNKFLASSQHEPIQQSLEPLFDHLSDDVMMQLYDVVEQSSQQMTMEQMADEWSSDEDKHSLIKAMQRTPNLLMALLILKAAHELNLEIGVSIISVLNYFNVKLVNPDKKWEAE